MLTVLTVLDMLDRSYPAHPWGKMEGLPNTGHHSLESGRQAVSDCNQGVKRTPDWAFTVLEESIIESFKSHSYPKIPYKKSPLTENLNQNDEDQPSIISNFELACSAQKQYPLVWAMSET